MRKIMLIVSAALALAACDTQARIASPGDSYLACSAEPDVLEGDPVTGDVTDEQNAGYLTALRGAGQDCRSKVQYLHDWFAKLKH